MRANFSFVFWIAGEIFWPWLIKKTCSIQNAIRWYFILNHAGFKNLVVLVLQTCSEQALYSCICNRVCVSQEEEYEAALSGGHSSGEETALLLPDNRDTTLGYSTHKHTFTVHKPHQSHCRYLWPADTGLDRFSHILLHNPHE